MLKIGDRVVCVKDEFMGANLINKKGVIIIIEREFVGVKFDKHMDGHTCGGLCKNGYGWSLPSCYLRLENINRRIN